MDTRTSWRGEDDTHHEIYTGTIFLGTSYLGSFQYDSGREDLGWSRASAAFFCPSCGDIWARLVATDSRGFPQSFVVFTAPCAEHPWQGSEVPGSLLLGRLANHLPDLPPAAVVREFKIHLEHFSKELA
jgi:hypothetical protein